MEVVGGDDRRAEDTATNSISESLAPQPATISQSSLHESEQGSTSTQQGLQLYPLPPYGGVRISVLVQTTAKTGIEMEALAGVVGAGLTVIDMCKSVDRGLRMEGIRVVWKRGGKSGDWGEKSQGRGSEVAKK